MNNLTQKAATALRTRFHFSIFATMVTLSAIAPGFGQVINPIQAGVLENGSPISPNLAGASSIAVQGNYAYVVSGSDVLEIFDISLPGSPLHKSSLRNGDGGASILKPSGIVVSGNYLYIANNGGNSVETIDVTDPSNPVHKATIFSAVPTYLGLPQGISISGNLLLVPTLINWTIEILDISAGGIPVHKGFIPIYPSNPYAVVARGNLAYVASFGRIVILDISNPASPTVRSSISTGKQGVMGEMRSLTLAGNYLYAVDRSNNRLEVIDVTNSTAPLSVFTLATSSAPWCIATTGNALYVGGDANKMDVYDITNPAVPVVKTGLTSGLFRGIRSITIDGNTGYIADQTTNSMVMLNLGTPLSPSIKSNVTTTLGLRGALLNDPQSVFVAGDFAYVADRTGNGLEIIDVSDPSKPAHLSSITNGTGANFKSPKAVSVSGNYAYVAGNGSLEIVDVTNPAIPTHKSFMNDGNGAAPFLLNSTSIFILGNYAYITSYDRSALEIVNISNPASPTHAGLIQDSNLAGAQSVYVATISNTPYAFVASSLGNRLTIVDVSNPATPVIKKVLADGGGVAPFLKEPMSVFVADTYAYVVSRASKGLEIVDVSNPSSAVHKGFIKDGLVNNADFPVMSYPRAVHVVGNTAYVAGGSEPNTSYPAALEIIDVTDRAAPKHLANLNNLEQGALMDGPTSLFVAGNYVYITNSLLFTNLNVVYLYGPSITSFSPTSGPAGTSVTVTGQNFNTFVEATVNKVPAKVTSVTATSLVFTVPDNATVGKIELKYKGQAFEVTSNFFVTPAALPATSVSQTGFTANWKDVGSQGYYLDLSTTNTFTSTLPGFNGRAVGNVTSLAITGLTAGTTYYFRVRPGVGAVTSSNAVSVLTLPATPVSSNATSIKQNSFSFSWNAVGSAQSYSVDVATDNSFNSMLGNYSSLSTTLTSININSLDPGQAYYYRVRAVNAGGSSPSSVTQSTITIPLSPVATTATSVTTTGITANWLPVNGAAGYNIDISTDNFATFVPGYSNALVSSGNSFAATLTSGTPYQYRVRAFNISGKSDNSNIISVLTLTPTPPDQPSSLTFSGVTKNSVNVSFKKATSDPLGYIVVRSIGSSSTTRPTNGTVYQVGSPLGTGVIAYVGPSPSFLDEGLATSMTYFYTIYAYNGTGVAANYNVTDPLQGSIVLDVDPPLLSASAQRNPSTITSGNTPLLTVNITDNVSVASAKIFYRGISAANFSSAALTPPASGALYSVQVQSDWYDSLGIEYYFIATDQSGNSSSKPASSFAQTVNSSLSLPELPSGPDEFSYRIVAFPYQLSNGNNISAVYPNVPWNDNTKSGLWWWNPVLQDGSGDYDQFGSSATLKTIDPGKGYWMITRTPVTPLLSNVPAPAYNRSKLFQLTLKPGWNQIGNPYPVAISWDDVASYNLVNNPNAAFGSLNVFTGSGYKQLGKGDLLPPFTGGFVKNLSPSDITIEIPFKGQAVSGGRLSDQNGIDLSDKNWNVRVNIEQNERKNELGGFGMNEKAITGEDRFDNFNPPSFLDIPQLNFVNHDHPNTIFSNDVVLTNGSYTWSFTPHGQEGQTANLSWDRESIRPGSKQLILLDEENLQVVDMTSANKYSFTITKNSSFRVFFGDDVQIEPGHIGASSPFPNPISNEVAATTVNVALPDGDKYLINVRVFNLQGIEVTTSTTTKTSGIHPLKIAFPASLPDGIYIYKLNVTGNNLSFTHSSRILKQ